MQISINTNGFKPICLSVLRPLGSTGKYYLDISMDDLKKNNKGELTNVNKKTKIIAYTKACKSRIKYSGIDISKVCDKHNNSTVGFKDEINYTITIKNNGTKGYKGLVVKEYIDSSLVECNMKNQQIKNGKIELTWKNINISAGSTKKISFKVKVKDNLQNLNKKIVSEGNVNNIATTKIINNIDYTLSKDKQIRLINEANSINYDKYTNGKEMISDIYKNALGIDIDLKKGEDSFLKVSDIIKTNESKDVEIINNNVKKMVLNDFYGTWTASKKVCNSNRYWIWGTANQECKDQNAKTILKGNLDIGDIIMFENNGCNWTYLYLGDKIIGANKIIKETKNVINQYDVKDKVTVFLSNLVSKDAFVILRPAKKK